MKKRPRMRSFADIALLLIVIGLVFAAVSALAGCERAPCWENPACDQDRN